MRRATARCMAGRLRALDALPGARDGSRRRRRARRRRRRSRRASRHALGREPLDVDLDDAPVGPGSAPGERPQVEARRRRPCDARSGSRAARRAAGAVPPFARRGRPRGGLRAAPGAAAGASAGAGSASGCARSAGASPFALRGLDRLAGLADERDRRAELGRLALLHEDLEQDAGLVALELHRRLVGLDVGEHVALGDRVALLLGPARDRPPLHRVGEARHRNLDRPSANPFKEAALGEQRARCGLDLVLAVERGELERLGVRHRHLGSADALDGRVEIVEAGTLDARRELGSDPVGRPALLGDQRAARPRRRTRRRSRRRAGAASAGRRPRSRSPRSRACLRRSARGARCSCARRS